MALLRDGRPSRSKNSPILRRWSFDLAFSEAQLDKLFRRRSDVNICLADAKRLPIDDNSVDIIVSTEVFEHIPDVGVAIAEARRVCRPGGKLICSIPNNFCKKYVVKGPHPDHVNNWNFQDFSDLMKSFDFYEIESSMRGWWIPLPRLVNFTFQLPFAPRKEYVSTNFLYVFDLRKV
jgi:SAM-dependent methyltransferase